MTDTAPPHAPLAAAKASLARLGGDFWRVHGGNITLDVVSSDLDTYTVTHDADRLCLSGSSPAALVTAFGHYLETVECGHFSRAGSWVTVPENLPIPPHTLTRHSRHRWRFAHNPTVAGYTTAYWDWERWENEIDLLAASGVNLVFMPVGVEAVWLDTFTDLGYAPEEVLAWISPPGHLPWQVLGNLASYGGGITQRIVDTRAELSERIIERLTHLDITAVFPGFAGYVPDGFTARMPQARVLPRTDWNGFAQPDLLDPSHESFAEVARSYYENLRERFGPACAFSADLLHESDQDLDLDLTAAAEGISAAMSEAHPDYLWVLQGWQHNPREEILAGIPDPHALVLDLMGEGNSWSGKPRTWGYVSNFGGRQGMFGPLAHIAENAHRSGPVGTAAVDEGLDGNPVVWALTTETAWHDAPPRVEDWLRSFVTARYGRFDARATQAWHGLLATVYHSRAGEPGGADSLLCAEPSLDVDRASVAAPRMLPYPPEALEVAWRDLERARPRLKDIDTYQYDLVDITRQVLSNRARLILPLLRAAYHSGSTERFTLLCGQFIELFDLLDPVLATRREFMLGPWLTAARKLGNDTAEANLLEFDARSLITTWGDTTETSGELRDYANREWAGLVSGFYRPRWEKYLNGLAAALRDDAEPEPIDFRAEALAWTKKTDSFATEPEGDPVAACRAIHHALPYFEGLP